MHSFQWTAKDVVSSAGKGAVYILAEKQTSAPKEHIMNLKAMKEAVAVWVHIILYK